MSFLAVFQVETNKCRGFIDFYSTLPSSGLARNISGLSDRIETQVFDKEKIEGKLLGSAKGVQLAERYFPESIKNWRVENPTPAKIFTESPKLECVYCHKDLLEPKPSGIIVLWQRMREDYEKEPEYFENIYWCCKGPCDHMLGANRKGQRSVDGWEDIPDVLIPHVFIKWVMWTFNGLKTGTQYSDEAYAKLKAFLLNIYPYVARHLTSKEEERLATLKSIPSYLGGMGY